MKLSDKEIIDLQESDNTTQKEVVGGANKGFKGTSISFRNNRSRNLRKDTLKKMRGSGVKKPVKTNNKKKIKQKGEEKIKNPLNDSVLEKELMSLTNNKNIMTKLFTKWW